MFAPVVEHIVEKLKSTEMVLMQPDVAPLLNTLHVLSQNKDLGQVTLSLTLCFIRCF
jgi:hypothetical protein